jgi:hypothetical protein
MRAPLATKISKQMMAATDDDHTIHNLAQSVFAEILAEFRDWKIKYSEHILR